MDPGGLIRTVGGGAAGLVMGAIGAIGAGIGTMIHAGEHLLPEPWFAIVVVGGVGLFVTWLVRK